MKKNLEIGGGRTPYFIRYRTTWNLEDCYISIDVNEANLEMSKQAFEKHSREGKVCPADPLLMVGDASNIDMIDEYVDEVVISNTISAPIHYDWDRDGYKLKTTNKEKNFERQIKQVDDPEDPFYIERRNLLKESLRVLKRGGCLSIYTDLIVYGLSSYLRLLNEICNDFNLIYYLDKDEAKRIDAINVEKVNSGEFCCCFRAEVLPASEVHRFVKI